MQVFATVIRKTGHIIQIYSFSSFPHLYSGFHLAKPLRFVVLGVLKWSRIIFDYGANER